MKIAIWYHCVLRGPRIPSEDHAVAVLQSQMNALRDSGACNDIEEFHIGVNGSAGDCLLALSLAPSKWCVPGHHQFENGQSELTTLGALQKWLKPGWLVLYHHIKGVQYPNNPVWDRWRNCMEKVCVWNWETCVRTIVGGGFDTVGAHWMTDKKYPMVGKDQRYWGGNFWWATSDYLMTLPPLPADSFENRYEAEVWIGKSPRPPRIYDFAPHWPMNCP